VFAIIDRAKLAALTIFIAASVQACSSSTTDAGGHPPEPAFGWTLGASALSLQQGSAISTFIKVARTGGLSGAITYTVAGAPAGLAVTVANTTVADSSILTIAASGTLATATYSIAVSGAAPGAATQQAAIAVTVTARTSVNQTITFVAAGAHTCALSTAGAAYCWGYNANGQLGNDDTSIVTPTPVATLGGLAFQTISVSKVEDITCALTTAGAAYCWGANEQGQIGDGTKTRRLVPTAVAGGLTFKSVAVGNGHVCGIATNGAAYCWGSSPNGAFGDGTVGEHLTPTPTAAGMSFQSVVAGSDYTCALTTAGAAYCWGLGFSGQLGNGVSGVSDTPVAVSGGLTFRSLAAGGRAACGLTTTGKAYCWGDDFYGTLGDGTDGTSGNMRRLVPVAVGGGLTFQSLSAGFETMCGTTAAGAGYCWGYNYGALGDGTQDHRSSPVPVAGGLNLQTIAGGTGYACSVTTAGAVYCWGDNSNGQLGDGTIAPRLVPAPVRWP
jgi:Regulator of chromosome condensation (RCC1) repeat